MVSSVANVDEVLAAVACVGVACMLASSGSLLVVVVGVTLVVGYGVGAISTAVGTTRILVCSLLVNINDVATVGGFAVV